MRYELPPPLPHAAHLRAPHQCAFPCEALDRLVTNHMLSTDEQRDLLRVLEPKLSGANAEWLQMYYRCKLDPEHGGQLVERLAEASEGTSEGTPTEPEGEMVAIHDNCDMLTAAAEYEYNHDRFRR